MRVVKFPEDASDMSVFLGFSQAFSAWACSSVYFCLSQETWCGNWVLILQGELNQQRGLVPSNFLEAVTSDGDVVEDLHSKDKDTFLLSAESQVRLCDCVVRTSKLWHGWRLGTAQHAAPHGVISVIACSSVHPMGAQKFRGEHQELLKI